MSPRFMSTVLANHTHLASYTRIVSLHRVDLAKLITAFGCGHRHENHYTSVGYSPASCKTLRQAATRCAVVAEMPTDNPT
jgi:hypothetical protein